MLDVGAGEGLREETFVATAIRDRAAESDPNFESVKLVRL